MSFVFVRLKAAGLLTELSGDAWAKQRADDAGIGSPAEKTLDACGRETYDAGWSLEHRIFHWL